MSFKRDFLSRLIIALVMGLIGLTFAWYSTFTFVIVLVFFTGVALWEYFSMVEHGGFHPYRLLGFSAAIGFFISAYLMPLEFQNNLFLFSIAAVVVMQAAHSKIFPSDRRLTLLIITIFGAVYIGGSLSFAVDIRKIHDLKLSQSSIDLLFLLPFVGAWSADTGAYISGKILGRDKLAPTISEKKSVEGFIGGIAAASAAVCIYGRLLNLPLSLLFSLGIIIPIFGAMGDLFESTLKRRFELKDSGTFFRAHGGVLDRFDSVFFALPVTYAILYFHFIYQH